MAKMQLGIAFLVILCICISATTATVEAYSESFSLIESASVSRTIFANEGDRLVGNFSVSNIPTWTDSNTGNLLTVQYAFKISKIEGSEKCPTDIVLYEVDQTEHASFDVYCEYTGEYRFRFNVGIGAPDLGVGNMDTTLNYDIIKNSIIQNPIVSPIPSDSQSKEDLPLSGPEYSPPILAGIGTLIVILLISIVYAVTRVKSFSHFN